MRLGWDVGNVFRWVCLNRGSACFKAENTAQTAVSGIETVPTDWCESTTITAHSDKSSEKRKSAYVWDSEKNDNEMRANRAKQRNIRDTKTTQLTQWEPTRQKYQDQKMMMMMIKWRQKNSRRASESWRNDSRYGRRRQGENGNPQTREKKRMPQTLTRQKVKAEGSESEI